MVFIHTTYTKQNPIVDLISAPPHSIPFLTDTQKDMWDLIENIRSKGIENPIWGVKTAVSTSHQIKDNQGRITEHPNGNLGDFIITGEIYAKIVQGLKEIEAVMIKEFGNDSRKISWLPKQAKTNTCSPGTHCVPTAFGTRQFCNNCNEKISYYYGNIQADIRALQIEYQELTKQKDETEQKKKQDIADKSYIATIWEKYKILFGKNFEREKKWHSEKTGSHKEYLHHGMPNSIKNPHNKVSKPTYNLVKNTVSITDYVRWQEETDNFELNSVIR
jgi:ribosomal protein S17E